MAVADRTGLPLAVHVAGASPHEVALIGPTLAACFVAERPEHLIDNRAYGSDPIDERSAAPGIELIDPHRAHRKRPKPRINGRCDGTNGAGRSSGVSPGCRTSGGPSFTMSMTPRITWASSNSAVSSSLFAGVYEMVCRKMHTGRIILNIVFVILLCEPSISSTSLEYQNRGNRYEGVKPKPVSGFDVELISVRVDYTEKVNKMPEQFKLRFYINQLSKIYLTVRELDNKYYYWMDKVRPTELWRPGFDNIFEWPTGDVIQQLGEIKMYDLGIVARLERPEPSKLEKVAPVIFYHSQVPATIPGYLFTFKTNGDTRLTCSVYKEGETEPVFTLPFPIQRGGRPFTVRWDSSQAREGSYKLVLRGYFLDTNDPIDQTVRFYHQPVVQ